MPLAACMLVSLHLHRLSVYLLVKLINWLGLGRRVPPAPEGLYLESQCGGSGSRCVGRLYGCLSGFVWGAEGKAAGPSPLAMSQSQHIRFGARVTRNCSQMLPSASLFFLRAMLWGTLSNFELQAQLEVSTCLLTADPYFALETI